MQRTFKYEERTYRYQYTDITALQAEYARELGEFKQHQIQSSPDSFDKIVKSRGTEWLPMMMSYLVREVKDKKLLTFDIDNAETTVYTDFCNIPASEITKMREVVEDFFFKIGQTQLGSSLLAPRKKRLDSKELLVSILQAKELLKENADLKNK